MAGRARYLYAGGNTALGFYSYYNHITVGHAARLWIIKGGPGVGKSTFVRAVGEAMRESGFDVEYFCCSSDNDSLDGVRIPALEIALVDGTAPHIIEPKFPGAVDELLDLGAYWDGAGIRSNRDAIIAKTPEVSRHFARAYSFLAAAKHIYDDISATNAAALRFGAANQTAHRLIEGIFGDRQIHPQPGIERHLFASAITPQGPVNHLDNLVGHLKSIWIIEGEPGTGKSTLLAKIARASVERGLYTEVFHCAFNPLAIDHIIIPELDTAVVTSTQPHTYAAPNAERIDMNAHRDDAMVRKHAGVVADQRALFDDLLQRAVACLAQAKDEYQVLESYYVKHMDFQRIAALREQIVERIWRYAKQS